MAAGPLFLESCVFLVEGTFVHEIWRPAKKHRHTASYAPRVEVGHTPGDSPGWVTDRSALGYWARCASAFLPASQVGGPIIKIGGRDFCLIGMSHDRILGWWPLVWRLSLSPCV